MKPQPIGITGGTLKLGYRFQRYWDTPMASAFFCGETGAGLFLVSMLLGLMPGMILGLLVTGVGKTYFHLSHMGVPAKSWRAILRPDRSWVSRGLIAIVLFIGFGTVHVLDQTYGLVPTVLAALGIDSLGVAGALSTLIAAVAGVAALVVITYQGLAMSHSSAIALWSTGLMPVGGLAYAPLAGTAVAAALIASGWGAGQVDVIGLLVKVNLGLLALALGVVLGVLHGANFNSKGGHQSVELLLKTLYARPFIALVFGIGMAVPVLILLLVAPNPAMLWTVAVSELVGYFAFRVLMFKAGVFEPILDISDGLLR